MTRRVVVGGGCLALGFVMGHMFPLWLCLVVAVPLAVIGTLLILGGRPPHA